MSNWAPFWDTAPLRDVADFRNGVNFNSANKGRGIKVVGVSNFQDYVDVPYHELDEINPTGVVRAEDLLQENDFVFVRSNGNRALIGRSLFVRNLTESVTHSGFTIRLRFISDVMRSEFFSQLIRSDIARNEMSHFGSGTNISNLSQEILGSLVVPLPPLHEQRAIAAILSTWDEAITLTTRLIEALQRRKQALMQLLLTGAVRFPGFDGEWKRTKIGDVLQPRKRLSKTTESTNRLVSVRRRSGGLFWRATGDQDPEESLSTLNRIHVGDFLISRRQVVHGAMSLVPPEFDGGYVSDSYVSLTPYDKDAFEIRFFDWLSKTYAIHKLAFVSSHGVHIEKLFFDLDTFLGHHISVPPTASEQTHISNALDSIETYTALQKYMVEYLTSQKRGLMQQLLTGAVRVGEVEAGG
ncbi:MAG: restriction endonuclease subunit S [Anaerolineae bacterium]|nr:restriction endonuclease subunit S [Anaerolineae bacterium]